MGGGVLNKTRKKKGAASRRATAGLSAPTPKEKRSAKKREGGQEPTHARRATRISEKEKRRTWGRERRSGSWGLIREAEGSRGPSQVSFEERISPVESSAS